ncbi:FG-GAP-like repeat-containing protein [Streptomyces globosus]|uniref:FG-GAP-like repeat-containing protein n=1 Tax=Streptomyces globosus TaxID=68209 RepID=UPI0031CEDE91
MKPIYAIPRLAVVLTTLGAGLIASPAVAAGSDPGAPTVTAPRSDPAPGFAGDGRSTPCATDPDTEPGWIGLGDIDLYAATASPAGTPLRTTFQLWDTAYGGKRTDIGPVGPHPAGEARTELPGGALADGGRYAWRVRTADATRTSPYTAWCHFRVDRTPPTAGITSTDFPASGSGGTPSKTAGQEGTFTLTGTDTGSGIACARWGTGTPSVGWSCADAAHDSHVVRLTDGSADIAVTPGTWGTNTLHLQTMDEAGNVSQPYVHTYYAPPPQNPKVAYGDIDGDGTADVLVPDDQGSLRKPGAAPSSPANGHRLAAPGRPADGWTGIRYTHRGSLGYRNTDDLLAQQPGSGVLLNYRNNGRGLFTDQAPVSVRKPTGCQDPAGQPLDCTAVGFGDDWTGVTALAAVGSPSGDAPRDGALERTSVAWVENGRLWLAGPGSTGQLDQVATLLSGDGAPWADHDLLTPGRAQGTDIPTLWARSRTTGEIRAFSLGDAAAFAAPAAAPVLGTAHGARVGSDGDLTGDGIPDVWTISADGRFAILPGRGTATPYPSVTGFGAAR